VSAKSRFLEYHSASLASSIALSGDNFVDSYLRAVELCVSALRSGRRIFTAGNGGSHADAIHIAGELVNYFTIPHEGFPVMALGCNPAVLTSWGNDQSFDDQFSRELSAYASKDDVFICLTTSGKSKNIHNAIRQARKIGTKVIAMTSTQGVSLLDADVVLAVPSQRTPHIQEGHIIIYHALCAEIEFQLTREEH
jgi:D-sedoheptulose 7-phosphate isomerase